MTLSWSAKAKCVPADEKKPVVYKFTVTLARCVMPGMILGYSLLISFVGIYKSRCLAERRHDFWFKPPKEPEPPKSAKEKAKARLLILKVLCFGAFLSGVLGRAAVPIAMIFLVLLIVWTIFSPCLIGCFHYVSHPRRLLYKLGFHETAKRLAAADRKKHQQRAQILREKAQ